MSSLGFVRSSQQNRFELPKIGDEATKSVALGTDRNPSSLHFDPNLSWGLPHRVRVCFNMAWQTRKFGQGNSCKAAIFQKTNFLSALTQFTCKAAAKLSKPTRADRSPFVPFCSDGIVFRRCAHGELSKPFR